MPSTEILNVSGNFPHRLAPDLVRVITLNDDQALIDFAQPIVNELRANMVRVDADFSATPFKAKIANMEHGESLPPPHVRGYGWSSEGRGERASSPRRPARGEAVGGSDCGQFG